MVVGSGRCSMSVSFPSAWRPKPFSLLGWRDGRCALDSLASFVSRLPCPESKAKEPGVWRLIGAPGTPLASQRLEDFGPVLFRIRALVWCRRRVVLVIACLSACVCDGFLSHARRTRNKQPPLRRRTMTVRCVWYPAVPPVAVVTLCFGAGFPAHAFSKFPPDLRGRSQAPTW